MFNNLIRFVFVIILLGSSKIADGQFMYAIDSSRNDPIVENQINNIKTQIDLLKKTNHNDTLGIAYYFLGLKYYLNEQNLDSASHYSVLAERFWKKSDYDERRRVINFQYSILFYEENFQYSDLTKYYLANYRSINHQKYLAAYIISVKKTAEAFQIIGDNETALRIINQFLSLEKNEEEITKQLSDLYLEKGKIETKLGDLSAVKRSYKKVKEYEKKLPKNKQSLSRWINIINQEFLFLNKIEKHDEAFKLANQYIGSLDSHEAIALFSNNVGYSLILDEKFEDALKYIQTAYVNGLKIENSQFHNKADYVESYAETLFHLDSLDKAQAIINQSIHIGLNGRSAHIDSLVIIPDKIEIVDKFFIKSRILLEKYKVTKKEQLKDSLTFLIDKIDILHSAIIEDQLFDKSILSVNSISSKYYRHVADVFYEFGEIDDFLHYSEKNRNLLLFKNLVSDKSHTLIDSLNLLENEETELKYLIQQTSNESLKDSLHDLQNRLIFLKTEVKALQEENSVDIINRANVNSISKNANILYFQYGLDTVYRINISNGKTEVKVISSIEQLHNKLEKYIPQLQVRSSIFNESLSKDLYRTLIPEPFDFEKDLLIIADKQLNYLPFESLLDEDGTFFIEQVPISYTSSLSLFHYLSGQKTKTVDKIYILSPDYKEMQISDQLASTTKGKMTFNYLVHSKKEVENIADILPTEIAEGIHLNKQVLISQMAIAKAVHFTGHAVMIPGNEELSFLALESDVNDLGNVITLAEISKLNSNAEMIFMNACNTGNGTFLEGEGIYNLSRAFLTAGSKSIISGLWEIDDQSSSQITTSFYKMLKDGESKSNALRLAKINYLKNASSDRAKHPYYWSGLIAIGNMDPVQFSSGSTIKWIIVAILFFVLLFFSQLRQIKK